jgi:stalled ribosome rescue protein Dom34
MLVSAGLWIDHVKALIVITFEGGEKKLAILSHVEPQPEADAGRQRTFTGHLNRFYAEVIKAIRDAESILIFGPGEAKVELRNHLDRACLGAKVVGVEPADEMTEPQIAAKVRERFQPRYIQQGTA